MSWSRRLWLVLALLPVAGRAQDDEVVSIFGPSGGDEKVTWSATAVPDTARPGEVVTLHLTADIAGGWHVYAAALNVDGPIPVSFTPDNSAAEPLGGLREDEPSVHQDEGFGIQVLWQAGQPVFRQPFRLPAGAADEVTLGGTIGWQACNDTSCLPPDEQTISVTVAVEPGEPRPEYAEPEPETAAGWQALIAAAPAPAAGEPPAMQGSFADQARARGLVAFLLVAFLAGLAALLTPCVFPMIPITVSFFTKQAGDESRKRVGLASAYGLGIILMYTGLGLILAATQGGGGAQRLAASPLMNLFFAALFVFFAASLFGYFELQLPSGLVNFASRRGSAGGYLGALFMGLTLTLAAFTCTVQFVGGVLVWAANGEWLWPILGMLSFSTAFALPFFLLALFPQYLASLPKSGGWLEATKVTLGFIELGAAAKFLSNADLVLGWKLLSRELVLALWAICAAGTVAYLWGKLTIGHSEPPARLGRGRAWWGAMFLALTLYFLWGLTGARLGGTVEALMPPPEWSRDPAADRRVEAWHEDYQEALAAARASGRNLFIDFTGVTCTNCRWMEQNIFTQPAVSEAMSRYELARLFTDVGELGKAYQQMQEERYGTASLPFYAIITPDEETIATFDGLTRNADEFVAFLNAGG